MTFKILKYYGQKNILLYINKSVLINRAAELFPLLMQF